MVLGNSIVRYYTVYAHTYNVRSHNYPNVEEVLGSYVNSLIDVATSTPK